MKRWHLLGIFVLFCAACENKPPQQLAAPTIRPAVTDAHDQLGITPAPRVAPTRQASAVASRLTISSLVPAPNSTVSPDTLILLNFEQPLRLESLSSETFRLEDNSGQSIALRLSSRRSSLTLTPTEPLAYDTEYVMTLKAPLRGERGEILEDLEWSFATQPPPISRPPTVVLKTPSPQEQSVAVDQPISVYFSQPLDPQSVTASTFRVSATTSYQRAFDVAGELMVEGTNLRFQPQEGWSYGTTYTVHLSKGIADLQGNRLEFAQEWSFATKPMAPGMVTLPAGAFVMGKPSAPEQRQVALSQPFYMLDHEVTVGEYAECVQAQSCQFSRAGKGSPDLNSSQHAPRPMTHVSWFQAQEYTEWLSQKYPGAYRLCTEAEWEYALRAGGSQAFGCGTKPDCLAQLAWTRENTPGEVPQLGKQKAPNAWGIYDLQGNVGEWVYDWYDFLENRSVTDPVGPTNGKLRTIRGGSFQNRRNSLTVWQRGGLPPDAQLSYIGFRVCATADNGA